jgi:hypothetical protein
MSERFRPGDKVIAYYATKLKSWESGWYKAVVVGFDPNGNYLVRWEPNWGDVAKPTISSVDEDEIRHRPDGGPYSGF